MNSSDDARTATATTKLSEGNASSSSVPRERLLAILSQALRLCEAGFEEYPEDATDAVFMNSQ